MTGLCRLLTFLTICMSLMGAMTPARAQLFNHLDCHYQPTFDSVTCPPMVEGGDGAVQSGRSADAPAAREGPPPLCTTFKTYDPDTKSYRGFDGQRHSCP